jgi:hypothetical protein
MFTTNDKPPKIEKDDYHSQALLDRLDLYYARTRILKPNPIVESLIQSEAYQVLIWSTMTK